MKIKLIIVIIAIFIMGCEPELNRTRTDKDYNIVKIDSCEYIEISWGAGLDNGYYSLTHKGNCKNCRKLIQSK